MKLRNNYNVGDRILILHANTKNQLRKNDVGKIGTILDKRCSFCIVRLDGDDRDKNYNYGTFGKINKVVFNPFGQDDELNFNSIEDALKYVENTYHITPTIDEIVYNKGMRYWQAEVFTENNEFVGFIVIYINNKLNDKNFDITKE